MIRSAVTIALVPQIKTGPWIFWENLAAGIHRAAELGFDGVELFTASPDAIDPDQLHSQLQAAGLQLAAVGTGAGKVIQGLTLTDPDPQVRAKAKTFIADMISFGARFGAPAIIGSMQGQVGAGVQREQALEWLAQGLNELGQHAGNEGVKLIYEPLNRYETNLVNTLQAGASLIDSLDTKQVSLLADLFHMNIEEESLAGSLRNVGAYVGHVHFADSNRRPMGMGHTAMAEVAAVLKSGGYKGFVSAEALPWPDPDGAARQTISAFKEFFAQ